MRLIDQIGKENRNVLVLELTERLIIQMVEDSYKVRLFVTLKGSCFVVIGDVFKVFILVKN